MMRISFLLMVGMENSAGVADPEVSEWGGEAVREPGGESCCLPPDEQVWFSCNRISVSPCRRFCLCGTFTRPVPGNTCGSARRNRVTSAAAPYYNVTSSQTSDAK
ncbi:hypothetical protein E2C01_047153 [Portunus trituberculatus]|uniref:TIL domain-containing protein n=1 Tax=Portunus trituberculatus TaxID=210409 RepID=A0A5B7G7R8_PORTR|nr:hypothetical protein [Portunus trituberculatus]